MSPKKTSVLEPLRIRIRRLQFIVGLGFIALVAGSMLSVALTMRLSVRVQSLPLGALRTLVAVALENLWLLTVLPMLCYGAARVMELRPWTTAAGAAVSGSVFVLALGFVQRGVSGLWYGGMASVLSVVAFAVGVALSARAVVMGRAAAEQQSRKAQAQAQERKSEYDEFLRAAEQDAARLEQREEGARSATPEPAAAQPPTPEVAVSLPEAQPPQEQAPSPDVPKTPAA